MPTFDFRYLQQLFIALVLTGLTVSIHSVGMNWVELVYKRLWSNPSVRKSQRVVMIGSVFIMVITHGCEVVIWALYYFLRGVIPNWPSAMHFSLVSYTTLGSSNIYLPDRWQGLEGFEAMTAMLMVGWSTAVLAAVVLMLHTSDK